MRRAGARRARACESFSKRLGAFGGKSDFCARAHGCRTTHAGAFAGEPILQDSSRAPSPTPRGALGPSRRSTREPPPSAPSSRLGRPASAPRRARGRAVSAPARVGAPRAAASLARPRRAESRSPAAARPSRRAPPPAPRAPLANADVMPGASRRPLPFTRARPPRASASTTRHPPSFNSPIFSPRHPRPRAGVADSTRPSHVGRVPGERRARFFPPNDSIRFDSVRLAPRLRPTLTPSAPSPPSRRTKHRQRLRNRRRAARPRRPTARSRRRRTRRARDGG